MELKDLVGEHELSGIDTYVLPPKEYWDDASNAIRFIMDGVTYCAIEDANDGYRSQLESLEITTDEVKNTFPPQKVIGKVRPNGEYEINDVIEFYDAVTDKLVLAIGTVNTDDYYPSCVLDWNPENMAINIGKQK